MNLIGLRQEVLNHGFDPNVFNARINQYINDGLALVARRVNYYVDDATDAFPTVAGTATYPWPANFARMRSLFDTDRNRELQYVSIRQIDQSSTASGAPFYYALVGENVQLYPVPDAVYDLEMRYWMMPPKLNTDPEVPSIPDDWHWLLWVYGTWQCYEAEDDAQMGQYWQQRFNTGLSMFAADVKFPDADGPTIAAGMWDGPQPLSRSGFGFGWW